MTSNASHKQALIAVVEAKAAEFHKDNAAGQRAGYSPKPGLRDPRLLSADGIPDDGAPLSFADWLRCVAEKDFHGHSFSVIEYVGGTAEIEMK